MKWQSLKDGRCPKCSAMLYQGNGSRIPSTMLVCSASKCSFSITEQRCKQIMESPPKLRNTEPEDNLARHE